MERKNKLLCREWKRWTALVMVVVIILLQPCTVLADAELRRTETGAGKDDVTESVEDMETDSVETESEEKEEAPINGDSEEISEEELQSETETEVLTEAFTEIEIEDAYDKGIEDSVEENLSGIETEEKVTEDMETDSDILLETESETVVYEDNLPLNRISEKTYTVTFYADNVVVDKQTVTEGEAAEEPGAPEKPGYTFQGWNGDYTRVTNSRNVYAKYAVGEFTTHTVTFLDYDGRLAGNRQYVQDGGSAGSPVMPERPGYTFLGWDESRFYIQGDKTLNAQYREGVYKTYTLNYYGYRNNKATEQILKEEIVVEGEDGVPPEPEEIEGYTFAGWDRNILYTNVYRSQNIKALYYKGKYRTHKVEFVDYNGKALLNPQYVVDGGSAVSPLKHVRDGYTFIGWDKENYRISSPLKIQALYKEGIYLTGPVSFYGKITGNPSWQLLKTEYVPVGDDAHPPKLPVNAGYTFREWSGQITGIQTAQNVYAQYNINTETETTYTVRFWCRGEVIKTEEVAIGGNATPPSVPGLKGYSFAGWDKSYVNINPGTRSMAVDITAQYQLTSGIQNAGSVSDLVNALMALGVPVAVKNGFSALGAAIINPFDGIILDVLAATALVGTIIYYWDDIKDLWEDIKVIFRNFAGMDAAGEILDNIEAGVDEAGKEDGDSEAVYAQAAIDARDAEIARICELSNTQRDKYVVVVAGYNKNTGQVAVGAKIEETGMRTYCAEDMVVAQLIEKGAALKEIVMTPGIRPRTLEIIAVCKFCQEKYSRDNFIPGTPFE